MKTIAINKKARFDYQIIETFEAGIELKGYEVKAVKSGRINLVASFVTVKDNQAWLLNTNIPPYQPANTPENYDSSRTRRLLLSSKELSYLVGRIQEKGLTIVPIKVYTRGGLIKLEIGLGRSKRQVDKREIIKKRDIERETGRRFKS